MATDTGTAKAKDTAKDKDNSSVPRDNRENSKRENGTPNQKGNSIPVQTQNPSNTGERDLSSIPAEKDNTSSLGRNSSQRNSPSLTPRDFSNSSETANSATNSNAVTVPVNPEDNHLHAKLNNKVANRAYELFQQNGANHGDDRFHWLQAESEILNRIPEVSQTDSSFSVIAPLESFSPEEISVTVEPSRALILADKQHSSCGKDSVVSQTSRESAFFVTDWPDEVEPFTATAQLKQGKLVLTVKRANGTSQNAARQ